VTLKFSESICFYMFSMNRVEWNVVDEQLNDSLN